MGCEPCSGGDSLGRQVSRPLLVTYKWEEGRVPFGQGHAMGVGTGERGSVQTLWGA